MVVLLLSRPTKYTRSDQTTDYYVPGRLSAVTSHRVAASPSAYIANNKLTLTARLKQNKPKERGYIDRWTQPNRKANNNKYQKFVSQDVVVADPTQN